MTLPFKPRRGLSQTDTRAIRLKYTEYT